MESVFGLSPSKIAAMAEVAQKGSDEATEAAGAMEYKIGGGPDGSDEDLPVSAVAEHQNN